ncbi:hypothetical protein D3C72_1136140 [compost metagenome]
MQGVRHGPGKFDDRQARCGEGHFATHAVGHLRVRRRGVIRRGGKRPRLARQHVGLRHHAEITAVCVNHRQGLQPVLVEQADGVVQGLVFLHGDDIARHDVGARHLTKTAHAGAQFGGQHDVFQVFLADVQELAALRQGIVQVGPAEAQAGAGRGIAGVMALCRVGMAAGVIAFQGAVEGHGNAQQDQGIQAHRPQREAIAQAGYGRPAQHRGQGHRAAGGMQAAQAEHGADGQGCRDGRSQAGQRNHLGAEHADQRRHHVARHDGPGLRKRAGGRGKQQHGRCAHGRDEPRAGRAQCVPAHPFRAEQPQQRAEHAKDFFAPVDAYRRWRERAQPALECHPQNDLLACLQYVVGRQFITRRLTVRLCAYVLMCLCAYARMRLCADALRSRRRRCAPASGPTRDAWRAILPGARWTGFPIPCRPLASARLQRDGRLRDRPRG